MRSVFWPRCMAQLSVVLDGRGAPNTRPLLVEVEPTACEVRRNGYHAADEFDLTIPMRALPFDPDLLSSAAATIYMFEERGGARVDEWALPQYEMIRGLVDDPEQKIDQQGSILTLTGRDYTSLLIDREWDPRRRIPAGRPLDEVVQQIADDAAPDGATTRFRVEFASLASQTPPIVGASRRSTKRKGLWVKPGKSVWQVIYDMAIAEGFIAFVRGETIHLTDPRTQTADTAARARRLVFGRNLQRFSARRHLAKERVPQIRVAAFDPVARTRVEVTYPPTSRTPTNAVGVKRDEVLRITAPAGVYDRATLERIARTRFENTARTETEYSAETLHLSDPDGQSMLELDAGMPLWVEFDPFDRAAMRSLTQAERVEHLMARGFSEELSTFAAAYFDRIDRYRQPHYVRHARFSYDVDSGLAIEAEVVNYAFAAGAADEDAAVVTEGPEA